jgi:F-type H+-transporting ATPase subunit epsilon
MAKLQVEVVTGERVVFTEDDVDMVVAPGTDGTLGILPSHAPLITTLTAGELRIKKGGGEQSLVVFGGFMEVTPTKVIVLADTAERAEEIDIARAEESRRRAEVDLANRKSEVDLAQAEATLRRAAVRLRVGQRRQRRQPPGVGGTTTGEL